MRHIGTLKLYSGTPEQFDASNLLASIELDMLDPANHLGDAANKVTWFRYQGKAGPIIDGSVGTVGSLPWKYRLFCGLMWTQPIKNFWYRTKTFWNKRGLSPFDKMLSFAFGGLIGMALIYLVHVYIGYLKGC